MLRKFRVNVNGKEYLVELEELGVPAGQYVMAPVPAPQAPITAPAPVAAPVAAPAPVVAPVAAVAPVVAPAPVAAPAAGDVTIDAPMPGNIISVLVSVGDQVVEDQALVVLEAMKMENELVSPKAGVIKAIFVTAGSAIDVGKPIITIG